MVVGSKNQVYVAPGPKGLRWKQRRPYLCSNTEAEERSKKMVELEVKRVEMEIKRTELELQHRLELTKLEAEREVMAARDQVELANLEASLAEQEMSRG